MKEATPKNPEQKPQQQQEGGQSLAPPAFGLSAAAPIQAKTGGSQPVQMANERSKEQEKLRRDFHYYRDLKSDSIKDPGAKASFIAKANKFIKWADGITHIFNWDQEWGNGDYKKRLKRDFSDYNTVLSGELGSVQGAALKDAEAALAISKNALANAQLAVEQSTTNVSAAAKAATEAEAEAVKAEAAATTAEANAKLPDAGEPEKAAAKKAREAATAARKAADAAKKAVEAAKGHKEQAELQKEFAAKQVSHSEAVITRTKGITDLQAAYRQQKGNASLKSGTQSLSSAIDGNLTDSNAAKDTAQSSAKTAKSQSEIAKTEEAKSKPIPGLHSKLKELGDETVRKQRKAKVKEIMTLVRGELAKYPPKVTNYKDQPTPDVNQKVKTIGELMAKGARVEWLLGTLYLEGSTNDKKWKGGGLSKSEEKLLGNHYESNVKAASGGVWCTAFLGSTYKAITGIKNQKGRDPNGEFWSGYKVGKATNFDYDESQGGKHVGRSEGKKDPDDPKGRKPDNSFVNLHKEIVKHKDDLKKRKEIVDQFFKDKIRPQAGDPMIVKRSTNKTANSFTSKGTSHTTMVEKLEGYKIHTLEGNAGNRVQGRTYDLTDPTDSGKIVFISRFSLNNYGDKPDPKNPKPAYTGPVVSDQELLAPMTKMSDILLKFAQEKGYADKLAVGEADTVSNLKQEGGSGTGE